jgi:hypothetical protein
MFLVNNILLKDAIKNEIAPATSQKGFTHGLALEKAANLFLNLCPKNLTQYYFLKKF